MATSLFRGAKMMGIHCLPKEGGRVCRLKVQCDYSEKLRTDDMKSFEWETLPATSASMDLDGELVGGDTAIFTPGNGLDQHQVETQFVKACKFKVVRVKKPKSDATEDVLRFEVLMTGQDSASLFDACMCVVGNIAGQLKLKYSTKQSTNGGEPDPPTQKSLITIDAPTKPARKKATVN